MLWTSMQYVSVAQMSKLQVLPSRSVVGGQMKISPDSKLYQPTASRAGPASLSCLSVLMPEYVELNPCPFKLEWKRCKIAAVYFHLHRAEVGRWNGYTGEHDSWTRGVNFHPLNQIGDCLQPSPGFNTRQQRWKSKEAGCGKSKVRVKI